MYDGDQMTDCPELRELSDSLSGVAVPGPPPLEAITARGREHRRRRLTRVTRLSVGGVAAVTVVVLGVGGAFTPAAKLGTIRAAAYTLRHNLNGTDTLTLKPGELLDPAQLQSDFARYGIPAKVTTGSYCTSDPEPAGFSQAVSGPGPGTWRAGSGQQPAITIDPSRIPAGTELTVGDFHLATGEFPGPARRRDQHPDALTQSPAFQSAAQECRSKPLSEASLPRATVVLQPIPGPFANDCGELCESDG